MLSSKMQEALNKQLNAELYSSYLYLAMAAHFESVNLPGMAHWVRVQAEEEKGHAMRFFDHIVERNGRVRLAAVEAPPAEWAGALAVFQAVYEHEQKVTAMIHDLVKLAQAESDAATGISLQWFVTEQVEEEKQADGVVQKLKMVKEAPHGLLIMDRELGQRQD